MTKCIVMTLFLLALVALPLQFVQVDNVYAQSQGNHYGQSNNGNNGNHYGGGSGGGRSHGTPDPGTTLTLLALGMTAIGTYSVFQKGKRN